MKDLIAEIDDVLARSDDLEYVTRGIPQTVTEVVDLLFGSLNVGRDMFDAFIHASDGCDGISRRTERTFVDGLDGTWFASPVFMMLEYYDHGNVRELAYLAERYTGTEGAYGRHLGKCLDKNREPLDWPAFAYMVEET